MNGRNINSMFLSIGDLLAVEIPNLYYRIDEKFIEIDCDKNPQDGWIHCPLFKGEYCGDRYKEGELSIIKIRMLEPVSMSKNYGNYFEFDPLRIQTISVVKRFKKNVLDELHHTLTSSEIRSLN